MSPKTTFFLSLAFILYILNLTFSASPTLAQTLTPTPTSILFPSPTVTATVSATPTSSVATASATPTRAPLPVAGSTHPLYILLIAGSLLLLSGSSILILAKEKE